VDYHVHKLDRCATNVYTALNELYGREADDETKAAVEEDMKDADERLVEEQRQLDLDSTLRVLELVQNRNREKNLIPRVIAFAVHVRGAPKFTHHLPFLVSASTTLRDIKALAAEAKTRVVTEFINDVLQHKGAIGLGFDNWNITRYTEHNRTVEKPYTVLTTLTTSVVHMRRPTQELLDAGTNSDDNDRR
jgi:hypothetical protein